MKLKINISKDIKEERIEVYARDYSEEIEDLKTYLERRPSDKFSLFKDDFVDIVGAEEIIRIYAQDKKTYVKTRESTYTSRLRLKDFEERLSKFIRISRSEIVNLDFVKRLDLSFMGTIALEFKDGHVSYVSRRNLKKFRQALGL